MRVRAPLPGGSIAEFEITAPADRCGECAGCRMVNTTKSLILADSAPAGPGIKDEHARMWNQILKDNPCQNPKQR